MEKAADSKTATTPQEALPQGQVPDNTLAAGELLSLKCPSGSAPAVKAGDIFPEAGAKAQYKILKVSESEVTLGFFQGGALKIEIPCSQNQKISSTALVKVLSPQDQPEAAPPLPVESLAYPLWFWIALALLFILPFAAYSYFQIKRKKAPEKKRGKAPPLNPSQKLEKYLKEASAVLKNQKDMGPSDVKQLYSQGYTAFRSFLDQRFKINAEHETTREFLGSLRSTATLWNLSQQDVAVIDQLLSSADQVRFASDMPESTAREAFVKNIYDFYKKYQLSTLRAEDSGEKNAEKKPQ